MNNIDRVAVCSRSFSKNVILRKELLNQYKNVSFNDEGLIMENKSLISFLQGHSKAIIAMERLDDSIISSLPELKVISKYGVGLDMIDLVSLRNHQKKLGWTQGVNKRSVSELTLTLIISLLRNVTYSNDQIKNGVWRQNIGNNLTGKKVGIIGCGNIGKDLVKILKPFNCNILVNDIVDFPDFYKLHNITPVDIEKLLSESDIITLHVPLNDKTKNILNSDKLKLIKSDAILINTARGGLVDEIFLKKMLIDNNLRAAAFDVFTEEPPRDYQLINLPNFVSTPHIGGSSDEAILAMGRAAIEGLDNNFIP